MSIYILVDVCSWRQVDVQYFYRSIVARSMLPVARVIKSVTFAAGKIQFDLDMLILELKFEYVFSICIEFE